MSYNVKLISSNLSNSEVYESKRFSAKIDLAVKRIGIAIIVALNIAALGGIYYAIISYCPIKSEAILTSSFLVGIIGALVSLKVPTFGITNYNLSQFLNPIVLLGRMIAYCFFGPTLLAIKAIDWTNYSDPKVANQVCGELKSLTFGEVAFKYGSCIDNLHKYGFLVENQIDAFKSLYDRHITHTMKKNYLKKHFEKINVEENRENPLAQSKEKIQEEEKTLENEWKQLKSALLISVKVPTMDVPDFSKSRTRFYHRFISWAFA